MLIALSRVMLSATCHAPPTARHDMRERLSVIRQVNPTFFFGTTRYDYKSVVKFNGHHVLIFYSTWEQIRSILKEDGASSPVPARKFLGLQESRILLTAGVAVPQELLEYFKDLDMPIIEAYGMSENTGGITVNPLQQLKLGSVEKPFPGTYVRINNPDNGGNGEVTIKCILYSWEYWHGLNLAVGP